MVRFTLSFPLGIYHAQATRAFGAAEWPPSPTRLIGALLAAAHEAPSHDCAAARAALERLCAAPPPRLIAPIAAGLADADGTGSVAVLRGASRWAPRNHTKSEIDKEGISPRNVGRERAEIHKPGVAIGAEPVHIEWDVDLSQAELVRLAALAADVTFLGTSRSPVVVEVGDQPLTDDQRPAERTWVPAAPGETLPSVTVRIPDAGLIGAYDRRHEARRAKKDVVQAAAHVASVRMGRELSYIRESVRDDHEQQVPIDPRWWGSMIVLGLDDQRSDAMRPRAAATFLVARAFREALLGAYASAGMPGEAPAVLRGRGDDPHAAIVPLCFVGHEHADGGLHGIAVLLPHERRLPDVAEQRAAVEAGLLRFVAETGAGSRRWIDIPGTRQVDADGSARPTRIWLRVPDAKQTRMITLQESRYRAPSRTWGTVTPVVHSRWRPTKNLDGLWRQVAADCRDAGLPEPEEIEVLRASALPGGPGRLLPARAVPPDWRGPLRGPTGHLRITFARPVQGPVILGRARHFGVGLCLPVAPVKDSRAERASAAGESGTADTGVSDVPASSPDRAGEAA